MQIRGGRRFVFKATCALRFVPRNVGRGEGTEKKSKVLGVNTLRFVIRVSFDQIVDLFVLLARIVLKIHNNSIAYSSTQGATNVLHVAKAK